MGRPVMSVERRALFGFGFKLSLEHTTPRASSGGTSSIAETRSIHSEERSSSEAIRNFLPLSEERG